MTMIKIWSLRFSVARGHHWSIERECLPTTVNEWLAVFRKSEPDVTFVASTRKPQTKVRE
jgi:hypothetical protein